MARRAEAESRGVKTVQAVEKAMRVLEVLADAGSPASLTDLSERLDVNISTLYRLLTTLCRVGFVDHNAKTGLYRLSMKNFRIGQAALEATDVTREARPLVEDLVNQCNETANIVVLDGTDVVYIDQVESSNMLRSLIRVGSRAPAHATGGGKVLLAALSPVRVEAMYAGHELERFTPNTFVSIDPLLEELARIEKRGYAVDDEEREPGVRCVAAPIVDHVDEAIAAVTVTGPAGRLNYDYIEAALANMVKACATRISERLGFDADPAGREAL